MKINTKVQAIKYNCAQLNSLESEKMHEQHNDNRSCSAIWHTEHVPSTSTSACSRNKQHTTQPAHRHRPAIHRKKCPSISPYRIIMLLFIGFPGLNTGKRCSFTHSLCILLRVHFFWNDVGDI